jgi:short-subunit dehydrogenase
MATNEKLTVVTGASKGIAAAISKDICNAAEIF